MPDPAANVLAGEKPPSADITSTSSVRERAATRVPERGWAIATVCLLGAYGFLGLTLVGDYGITYDEYWHATHGRNVVAWYASGFQDQTFITYGNLRFYGVLFDLPAVLLHRATAADEYIIRHTLAFSFAFVAVAGIGRLGSLMAGPAAGFFGAAALVLTPRFFGHGFNNCKDIPMAACMIWSVIAAITFVRSRGRPSRSQVAVLGIMWGLALAVRSTALFLAGVIGTALLVDWAMDAPREPLLRRARRLAPLVVAVAVIAGLVALPFWPLVVVRPLRGPAAILRDQIQAGLGTILVLYDGHVLSHREVPATYVWAWLVRITPEFYAAGLLLAFASAVQRRPWSRDGILGWTVVSCAGLGPLVFATLTRPAVYDGLRHFLFATVFLSVPVGAGLAWCVRSGPWRLVRVMGLVLVAVLAASTAADMIRLHPYQTTFFNRAVAGGLPGAAGRWDTDYWGNSFREGALWLVNHVPIVMGERPRVASSGFPTQTEHYLPADRFEYIGSVDHTPSLVRRRFANPPDYYVSFVRGDRNRMYPGEVLYRVERDGVTLLVVVKVDRAAALARGAKGQTP